MSFSHPGWLPAGLLACVMLLWSWRRYDRRQHAELARFVSAHLRRELTASVSIARRRAQRGLLLAAVALLFVALAAPLLGFRWEQVSRHGNEIVFAVDTSRSMSTPDVKPDRLTRATLAIDDFTNKLDGDAVGLVAFAGSAFLVCPITLDYGAFHESLSALDTNTIPRGGTNIASAIQEAQIALRRRPGTDKVLILVTDGEDLEGDALVAAQAAANQDSLKIYTIGVGTANGDLIPLPGNQANAFVKDASGNFVKSRLDESALKAIATATGGLYAPLGAQGQGFDTIYRLGLAPMLKHDLASRQQKIYTQRYQWPLAASLFLLLTSLLIGSRSRFGARRHGNVTQARPRDEVGGPTSAFGPLSGSALASASDSRSDSASSAGSTPNFVSPSASDWAWAPATATVTKSTSAAAHGLPLFLAIVLLLQIQPAQASTSSAEDAYKKGDFATAEREYAAAAQRDPATPALHFNKGTAAYRAGQFPQAAQAFQDSISRAPSSDPNRLKDQQDAYYNLGNTLYRTGQKTQKSSVQDTIQTWTQAVKAYDTALQLRADDADSKYNRDLVKRKIEALKQEQQKSPQQNPPAGNSPQNSPQNSPPSDQKQPTQSPPPSSAPPDGAPKSDASQKPPQQPPTPLPPAQQPPPQEQPNQPPPPPQPGQPKQQPPKSPGQSQPKAAPGEPQNKDPGSGDEEDPPRAPGQMSREEARELLDSVKGDERKTMGARAAALKHAYSQPDQPVRDW